MNLHKFKQEKRGHQDCGTRFDEDDLQLWKLSGFFIFGDDKLMIIIGSWVTCVCQIVIIVPKRLLSREKHKSGSRWYLSATLAFPVESLRGSVPKNGPIDFASKNHFSLNSADGKGLGPKC